MKIFDKAVFFKNLAVILGRLMDGKPIRFEDAKKILTPEMISGAYKVFEGIHASYVQFVLSRREQLGQPELNNHIRIGLDAQHLIVGMYDKAPGQPPALVGNIVLSQEVFEKLSVAYQAESLEEAFKIMSIPNE